jgi:hypothetical protein
MNLSVERSYGVIVKAAISEMHRFGIFMPRYYLICLRITPKKQTLDDANCMGA